jgi:hypothetical protein
LDGSKLTVECSQGHRRDLSDIATELLARTIRAGARVLASEDDDWL